MKYIDDLVKVSNNELLFAEELSIIKKEIDKSENRNKEVNLFIKNINKYCEDYTKNNKATTDTYLLFNTNNFCMFILKRMIDRQIEENYYHKELMKQLLAVSKLSKDTNDRLKDEFATKILFIMDKGFSFGTDYVFEKMNDDESKDLINLYNTILQTVNLNIIETLTNVKPIIFVGKKGTKSTNLGGLNIVVLDINDNVKVKGEKLDVKNLDVEKLDMKKLYFKTINILIDNVIYLLTTKIFNTYDLKHLTNKYNMTEEELKLKIGGFIGDIMLGEELIKNDLMNEVLTIASQNQTEEGKIKRKNNKMAQKFTMPI